MRDEDTPLRVSLAMLLLADTQLYADYGEALELLAVQRVPHKVEAGHAADAIVFEITVADVGPRGLVVKFDDDGSGRGIEAECDEDDNVAWWPLDSPCSP